LKAFLPGAIVQFKYRRFREFQDKQVLEMATGKDVLKLSINGELSTLEFSPIFSSAIRRDPPATYSEAAAGGQAMSLSWAADFKPSA
jgi:hypothetical protein